MENQENQENEVMNQGLHIAKKKKSFEVKPGFAYLIFFSSLFIIPILVLYGCLSSIALFLIPLFLAIFLYVDDKYRRNHPEEFPRDYDIGAH